VRPKTAPTAKGKAAPSSTLGAAGKAAVEKAAAQKVIDDAKISECENKISQLQKTVQEWEKMYNELKAGTDVKKY